MVKDAAHGRISARLELVRRGVRLTLAFEPPPGSGWPPWANVETFDSWGKAMEPVEALAKQHPACALEVEDRT